jgi:predicted metalloprotease with PDZ domain
LLFVATAGCRASLGSVGAVFRQDRASGRLWVRRVDPAMGSARAGLEPGDEVLSVEGRDVRDLSPEGVHRALAGEVGSTVTLTVERRGKIERLTVVRQPYRRGLAGAASPRPAAEELARRRSARARPAPPRETAQRSSLSNTSEKFSRKLCGVSSALRR